MNFLHKPFFPGVSDYSIDQDMHKCPFLKSIDKPTNFSFASLDVPIPSNGAKGPIFEDGDNFDLAFKLFHGKDGVVPLLGSFELSTEKLDTEDIPRFNLLPSKAASISMSAFGPGGPFSFHSFLKKMQKRELDSAKKNENTAKDDTTTHEALGNEWLKTGNCPIAKSYRAVNHLLPLVAASLRPPPGMKLKCPPPIVAARAALARTALVKTVRPQPLPAKILFIGALGIAANIPLGVWREHTRKFSVSWFIAVHAAVPFIAMLRKSVVMPKTAMALTIAGSILGQMIGSRSERLRLKAKAERANSVVQPPSEVGTAHRSFQAIGHCAKQDIMWDPLSSKIRNTPSTPANVCF